MAEQAEKRGGGLRKVLIVVVILIVVALGAIAGGRLLWAYLNPEQEEQIDVVSVRVSEAALGNIEIVSIHTGKVDAENQINVITKVAGKVASVNVKLGDTVKKGDVLFKIDPSDIQSQLNQAQIQNEAASSMRDQATSGIYAAQLAIYNAEQAVLAAEQAAAVVDPTSPPAIAAAGAQLVEAQTWLEKARAGYDQARGAWDQADTQYRLTSEGANAANRTAADLTVRSPIDGLVTTLSVQQGGMASQTMPSAVVTNPDTLRIATNVSESMIDTISVGDPANVTIKSISEEPFAGRISTIVPVPPQGQTTYPVYVVLDGLDARIKAGMFVSVSLVTQRAENVLIIPSDAVLIRTGKQLVAVAGADDKIRFAEIVTGLDDGARVEVKSGLAPGDRIVYEGQYYVDEESVIRIVE